MHCHHYYLMVCVACVTECQHRHSSYLLYIQSCSCNHRCLWSNVESFLLRNSISLEQNQFFLGTQAFASPTDMASSGVWENILLSKTPTLDGVCGILSFIIFLNICQIFLFVLLTGGKSTLYIVYDRCYCHIFLNH